MAQVVFKPTSVIKARLGIQKGGPVHAYFTNECAKAMDKYVPYREGGLAYKQRTTLTDKIIYNAPYARYMYEGKVMGPNIPIKDANGNIITWFSRKPKYLTGKDINYNISAGHEYAGPHWDKRMWSAESEDIIKCVQKYIDRGGK